MVFLCCGNARRPQLREACTTDCCPHSIYRMAAAPHPAVMHLSAQGSNRLLQPCSADERAFGREGALRLIRTRGRRAARLPRSGPCRTQARSVRRPQACPWIHRNKGSATTDETDSNHQLSSVNSITDRLLMSYVSTMSHAQHGAPPAWQLAAHRESWRTMAQHSCRMHDSQSRSSPSPGDLEDVEGDVSGDHLLLGSTARECVFRTGKKGAHQATLRMSKAMSAVTTCSRVPPFCFTLSGCTTRLAFM